MTKSENTTGNTIIELAKQALALQQTIEDVQQRDSTSHLVQTLNEKQTALLEDLEALKITTLDEAVAKARVARMLYPGEPVSFPGGTMDERLAAEIVEFLGATNEGRMKSEENEEAPSRCPVVDLGEAVVLNERRTVEVDATDWEKTGEERLMSDLDEIHDHRIALRSLITHKQARSLDGAAIQIALIDGYAEELVSEETARERDAARRAIRRLVYSSVAAVQDRVEADCHVTSLFLPDCENPFKPAKWRSQMARQEESAALAEVEAYKRRSDAQA
ncbi:MAG TPA: hypothetical protein DCP75_11880 [Haliea salexigens]|uniref:Uncharacterized protein n=1 Tax=Haliea salexigens TaxID=287487 RepID=A0A3C1KP02_9GAMM|nr:hypothetical protein [Haliea salexigens]|tara:strand:- start:17789 stop:18616 length:828 start_codon:yes stop_codon:yes gene_type:complete